MKTFARKKQTINAFEFPKVWSESVKEIYHQTFMEHLETRGMEIKVYGASFPDEILLISQVQAPHQAPVSIMLSADLNDLIDGKKLMDQLVDQSGEFLERYLNLGETEMDEVYEPRWLEHDTTQKIYVKISREDVMLTLEANRLLGEEFDD